MSLQIDIAIHCDGWPEENVVHKWVQDAVSGAMRRLDFAGVNSELSVVLTNDKEMRSLNDQWRGKDKSTNVLSFPAFDIKAGQSPGPMMGDIVMAVETVTHEAKLEAKPLNHHFTHLIVHGLLHLLGYDHENEMDAEQMEQLETTILDTMSIPDPYADNKPSN